MEEAGPGWGQGGAGGRPPASAAAVGAGPASQQAGPGWALHLQMQIFRKNIFILRPYVVVFSTMKKNHGRYVDFLFRNFVIKRKLLENLVVFGSIFGLGMGTPGRMARCAGPGRSRLDPARPSAQRAPRVGSLPAWLCAYAVCTQNACIKVGSAADTLTGGPPGALPSK